MFGRFVAKDICPTEAFLLPLQVGLSHELCSAPSGSCLVSLEHQVPEVSLSLVDQPQELILTAVSVLFLMRAENMALKSVLEVPTLVWPRNCIERR